MLIRRVSDPNQRVNDGPTEGTRFVQRRMGPPRDGMEAGGSGRARRPRRERDGDKKARGDQKGRGKPEKEIDDVANHLTDGDVLHLLRLQRAAWDPKPYEPIYAAESAAINELVENGRKLIFGEEVEEKPWVQLTRKQKRLAEVEAKLIAGGKYDISTLGLAEGSKAEEAWMGTSVRGVQINSSFTRKDREMFVEKVADVLGVKAPFCEVVDRHQSFRVLV